MSKHQSSCPACMQPCSDMARRFDSVLRFICPECHAFLLYADKALRKVGIEGSATKADKPNPETETP